MHQTEIFFILMCYRRKRNEVNLTCFEPLSRVCIVGLKLYFFNCFVVSFMCGDGLHYILCNKFANNSCIIILINNTLFF